MALVNAYQKRHLRTLCLLSLMAGSLFCSISAAAQPTRYLIRLRDKANNQFTLSNPSAFLSQRALDRRTRYQTPIDSTDLPVTQRYLDSIAGVPGVTILNASKWLNQVSIQVADTTALAQIRSFSFVLSSGSIAARMNAGRRREPEPVFGAPTPVQRVASDFFDYGSSADQVLMHHGNFLHNIGLRGQGMIIGMLDGGFRNYSVLNAFDSARLNGHILGTWDFVANDANVQDDISHGMQCASIIAANIPGQFVGTAPQSGFYFFRTEDAASEYPIEEHNWVCGAERTDSAGGDVISSSLGYYDFDDPSFNYSYATDFNGRRTISARGAVIAARKGLLVFNSAGNEGNNGWKFIVTPADVDSLVAVGAVDKDSIAATFSSYGPSADGRVKPDLASRGVATVLQQSNNTIGAGNGTSYSCPNLAGLGACLWQGFPEFNNIRILDALRSSGDRVNNPDNRTGYGIPDMKTAFLILLRQYATATASVNDCTVQLAWDSKDVGAMRYEIERQLPGEAGYAVVARVPALQGSVLANHSYNVSDTLTGAQTGNARYRIRQVIDTSSASFTAGYIDSVSVMLDNVCYSGDAPAGLRSESITLIPNPAPGNTIVRVETGNAIPVLYIRVTDMKGSLLWLRKESKGPGVAYFPVPTEQLPKGKYIVTVSDNQGTRISKGLIRL